MPPANLISFEGLGTHWECEIIDYLAIGLQSEIKSKLVGKLNEFTKLYSRFDSKSLVSRLNSENKIIDPPDEILRMFKFAYEMFQASDGVFNISIGGDLVSIGYGYSDKRLRSKTDFWESVVIKDDLITIPSDVMIDFGGFGKGWLIDVFVDILRDFGIKQFIVNGGGDMYVQMNQATDVVLEHPYDSAKFIGQTRMQNGALAVSSTIKRSWDKGGVRHHHIIDPFEGKPSKSKIISTFIKAKSTLIADTMATILIIKPELDQKLSKEFDLQTILLSVDQI